MKLLIDIDEANFNTLKYYYKEGTTSWAETIIATGTPVYEHERIKAEWIIDGHHIRCNRCNEYICNTDREGNKIPDNYCPNCGAEMRKGSAE